MIWPRRRLKKAPLPWSVPKSLSGPDTIKLDEIIRAKFRSMYGDRVCLSTREMKEWGAFLVERGISWEMRVGTKPNWDGWEAEARKDCFVAYLKGLDDHIKVDKYFVPRDLAMKMLVFGELV